MQQEVLKRVRNEIPPQRNEKSGMKYPPRGMKNGEGRNEKSNEIA